MRKKMGEDMRKKMVKELTNRLIDFASDLFNETDATDEELIEAIDNLYYAEGGIR
jgi:hypothetical protein